ncbi:MAG: ATP-dependent Clp protease adaptor ClpS [Bdellovibrionales bacterium GWA2_49_15]|nr:MAG: ATP-dependent Clp protease adaptor ClpS [Bdellovibrionales bacterium GWA2_49_15]HAZ13716.1 ATP-dependent Clp protease adapter ClpS [Bdellovibrionales bacterium]
MSIDENKSTPIFNPTSSQGGNPKEDGEGEIAAITRDKIKRPSLYKVLIHNDDYTTMEFVVFVLQTVFGKTTEEAQSIMLKVHIDGVGICGVYTYEVAETKVNKVERLARQNGHPLRSSMEQE